MEKAMRALEQLDYTAADLARIQEEVEEEFTLDRYKRMVTEFSTNLTGTTEEVAAQVTKRAYIQGYMEALEVMADNVSEIIMGRGPGD
ncbi:MAG: hypothetical protein LIO42_06990 [Oscillospiraceae bacterium]|nr:hypothetical protein [Oscillospiraceae bacterium]